MVISNRGKQQENFEMMMRGRILHNIILTKVRYRVFRKLSVLSLLKVIVRRIIKFDLNFIVVHSTPYGVPYLSTNGLRIKVSLRSKTLQNPAKKGVPKRCTNCHHFCTFVCSGVSGSCICAKYVPKRCTICHTLFHRRKRG